MVRRTSIRKRMRAKLRQVKQQLRARMHDPVPKPVDGSSRSSRLLQLLRGAGKPRGFGLISGSGAGALVWRTLRRRGQKRRISWTRILVLAQRWLTPPRTLHPFPDARFAATHLR